MRERQRATYDEEHLGVGGDDDEHGQDVDEDEDGQVVADHVGRLLVPGDATAGHAALECVVRPADEGHGGPEGAQQHAHLHAHHGLLVGHLLHGHGVVDGVEPRRQEGGEGRQGS